MSEKVESAECPDCHGLEWIILNPEQPDKMKPCSCTLLRSIANAMEPAVLNADVRQEHVDVLKGLRTEHVHFECSRTDLLSLQKAYRLLHQVTMRERVAVLTDAELAHNYYRNDDAEGEENQVLVSTPELLIIILGVQRNPHKSAASALLEAVNMRLKARRSRCWLVSIIGSEFNDGSVAYSDELGFTIEQNFQEVSVRVIADTTKNRFKRNVVAPVSTPAQRAQSAGRCKVCGGGIARGDEFVWADAAKGRAHPTCIPAKVAS